MMAGPGDERGAGLAARGRLRASHADREQVISALKAAYVQGRLDQDELASRVGQSLASRTYADLAALTNDLPAGLAGPPPARRPAPAEVSKAMIWGASGLLTPVLVGIVFAVGTASSHRGLWEMLYLVMAVYFMAWLAAGAQLLDTWRHQRSGGQGPPRRTRRDRPAGGKRPGGPGDHQVLCEARRDARPLRHVLASPGGPVILARG